MSKSKKKIPTSDKDTNFTSNGYHYWRGEVELSTGPKPILGKNYGDWKKKRDQAIKDDALGLIKTNDTIGEAFVSWLDNIYAPGKIQDPSLIHKEQLYLHNLEGDPLLKIKLNKTETIHLQSFVTRKAEKGRSYNQIDLTVQMLNKFFTYCADEGYVLRNPCRQIVIPGGDRNPEEEEERKIVVYTNKEIDSLLEYVKSIGYPQIRFFVYLALGTGARIGEILALDHGDISDILSIRKTVYRKKISQKGERGKYTTGIKKIPKTKAGKRDIALTDTVVKEYKTYKSWYQAEKLKKGLGKIKDEDPLFISKQWNRMGASSITYWLKKAAESCEFEYKSPHAFRHTFITKMAQAGTPSVDLMQITGHSSIDALLIYYHIEMDHKKEIIKGIEQIF